MAKKRFTEVFNSISDSMAYFIKLSKFTVQLLQQLQNIFTADTETVNIQVESETGVVATYSVPTMQSFRSKFEKQGREIRSLRNLINRNNFKPASNLIVTPPKRITNLTPPNRFITKPNSFLENFLNPMIFVQFRLNDKVDFMAKNVQVQRIILSPRTQKQIKYFNDTYNGKNNLSYDSVIAQLKQQGIPYTIDEDILDMPPGFIQNIGSFDVVGIRPNTPITESEYFLNKLTYAKYERGNYQESFLRPGDVLYTGELPTTYRVLSVDSTKESVKLLQLEGEEPIVMGVDSLHIASSPEKEMYLDIGVSFDEMQIIFIRPIDPYYYIMDNTWSDGVGFYSNDLVTETPEGTMTFEEYYSRFVTDYSVMLFGQTTDFRIPAAYGVKPNPPKISKENFVVTKVNKHKLNSQNLKELERMAAEARRLSAKILAYNNELSPLNESYELLSRTRILGPPDTPEEAAQKELESAQLADLRQQINELIVQRNIDNTLLSAILEQISTFGKSNNTNFNPVYRVQGFWPIPAPQFDKRTGLQEVVQFIIEYRYISLNIDSKTSIQSDELTRQQQEQSNNATQINFIGNSGEKRVGFFSPWTSIFSPVRKKEFDEKTGKFKWSIENVSDANENNINQVEIPITRGEIVEIRIRSISEAGWPANGIMSDWSDTVQVSFPSDILDESDQQILLNNIQSKQLTSMLEQQVNTNALRVAELSNLLNDALVKISDLEKKIIELSS